VSDLDAYIRGLPKTELHMHLEGSIEPEMMLALAARNGLRLRWESAAELRAAFEFQNLQSFLDLYFEGCRVLVQEQDFYDVTRAYLRRAHADGVIRAEVFIGPQSFTERGIGIGALMRGVLAAIDDGMRDHGLSPGLIISAHRHRSEADALELLERVMPWSDRILGIGMGGPEVGNPPSKFVNFFRASRERGFRTTVHAGEEGPSAYVREALELLEVDRIDHGVTCLADPALVRELAARKIPLTVCPLSNLRLKVVPALERHPLRAMLAAGLHVTVNSDDPAYFDGYVSENLIACRRALNLSVDELARLARNGVEAAFISPDEAARALARIDAYVADFCRSGRPGKPAPTAE
jgi:adenosine deaminase